MDSIKLIGPAGDRAGNWSVNRVRDRSGLPVHCQATISQYLARVPGRKVPGAEFPTMRLAGLHAYMKAWDHQFLPLRNRSHSLRDRLPGRSTFAATFGAVCMPRQAVLSCEHPYCSSWAIS